jgi:hypothetical protein
LAIQWAVLAGYIGNPRDYVLPWWLLLLTAFSMIMLDGTFGFEHFNIRRCQVHLTAQATAILRCKQPLSELEARGGQGKPPGMGWAV